MPANTLFTYASLATLSGAALAAALIVQVVQYSPSLRKLPQEVIAWVASVIVLGIAMAAQGQLQPAGIPLLLLNGLVVAATAIGAQQTVVAHFIRRKAAPARRAAPPGR